MKKKIAITLAILAAAGIGYYRYRASKTDQVQYQTAVVEKGTLVISVSASGQVVAANSAPVTTKISGVVKKIFVKDGDTVKTGQALLLIEPDQVSRQVVSSAYLEYLSAKNSLNTLNSKMFAVNQKFINDAVARSLAADDPTYIQQHSDWLASENDYKNQTLSISAAWSNYLQSSPTVMAPITGKVTGLSFVLGSVIVTSTKLASVVTNAPLTVSLDLTQIDVPKIKSGLKATVTFDSLPDKTYTGSVISVDTVGVTSSGVTSYPAVIKLDTAPLEILPNMAASGMVIIQTKADVLIIPSGSIQNSTVRVMKNGQVAETTVETGLISDSQTEILSGLSEGDIVVTGTVFTSTTRTNQTTSPFSSFGRGGVGGGTFIRTR